MFLLSESIHRHRVGLVWQNTSIFNKVTTIIIPACFICCYNTLHYGGQRLEMWGRAMRGRNEAGAREEWGSRGAVTGFQEEMGRHKRGRSGGYCEGKSDNGEKPRRNWRERWMLWGGWEGEGGEQRNESVIKNDSQKQKQSTTSESNATTEGPFIPKLPGGPTDQIGVVPGSFLVNVNSVTVNSMLLKREHCSWWSLPW